MSAQDVQLPQRAILADGRVEYLYNYQDGKKRWRFFYRDGQPDGAWEFWAPNGLLEAIIERRDGKIHGRELRFRPDGPMELRRTWRDSVPTHTVSKTSSSPLGSKN